MAKAKKIEWPPAPEWSARDKEIGQEAAKLRTEYLKKGKGGSGAGQRRWLLKAAALELLRTIGAPSALVLLFDVMLGGVSTEMSQMEPKRAWIDQIVDYEARAHNDGREVTNPEITDRVAMPARPEITDRGYAMREVREVRQAAWYPALVLSRRVYLIDNPGTA